jgi:hypothetical protein
MCFVKEVLESTKRGIRVPKHDHLEPNYCEPPYHIAREKTTREDEERRRGEGGRGERTRREDEERRRGEETRREDEGYGLTRS